MYKPNTYRLRTVFGTLIVVFGILFIFGINAVYYAREATAAPSTYLNFQGRLKTSAGAVVPDGNYNIEFKIYDAVTGGNLLWTETRTSGNQVRVANGYFSVSLGSVTAFGTSISDWSEQLYITMNIGGTGTASWDGEMTNAGNRMILTAVPYAFQADKANSLTDGTNDFGADDFVQLAPSAPQTVNDSDPAVAINQTGAGDILQLQAGGSDVFTLANDGGATLNGALTVNGTAPDSLYGAPVVINSTQTSVTNNQAGLYVNSIASPTAPSNIAHTGIIAVATSSSSNLNAGVNSGIAGFNGAAIYTGSSAIRSAMGGTVGYANYGSGTLVYGNGLYVADGINTGGGSITNGIGINIQNQTVAGNNVNLLIRTGLTAPTGNWNIYSDSTYNNALAGSLRVGGTTAPTVALDVTGSGIFSGSLTVNTGATISGGAINLNNNSNFDTNINTGTSEGAINIGNASSDRIDIIGGDTINIRPDGGTTGITLNDSIIAHTSTFRFVQASGGTGVTRFLQTSTDGSATNSIRVQSGNSGEDSGNLELWSGASNGTGHITGGVVLRSGNGEGTNTSSGNVTIDAGSATGTAGTISLGTTNASGITIGRAGLTTAIGGALSVGGNLLPSADDTYDLGSTNNRWRDLYLGPQSLHIGENGDEAVLSYDTTSDVLGIDQNVAINGTLVVANVSVAESGNLTIGQSDTTGNLLVLDTKTDSGDPTGVAGGMYYNSDSGKFRCYEDAWRDCISASAGDIMNGGQDGTVTIGTNDDNNLVLERNNTPVISISSSIIGISNNSGIQFSGPGGNRFIRTSNQGVGDTDNLGFSTGTASANGATTGSLDLYTGNATGTTGTSGNISIDVGTATGTAGILNLGADNASAINIGAGTSSSQIIIGNTTSTSGVSIRSSGGVSLTGSGGSLSVSSIVSISLGTVQFGGNSGNKFITTSGQGSVSTDPLFVRTGSSGGSNDSSGNLTLNTGSGFGTNTASGNVTIFTGNSTADSGDISLDVGTATGTTGSISIGSTNASNLVLGNSTGSITFGDSALANCASLTTVAGVLTCGAGGSGAVTLDANENLFGGYNALASSETADDNIAFGTASLSSLTSGSYNVSLGAQALTNKGEAYNNVALGAFALSGSGDSNGNVALGYGAGQNNTTGNYNVLLGYGAGDNLTSGSNNIILGYDLDAASASGDNQLNIAGVLTSTNYLTGNLTIGTADTTGQLLVLDTKSDAGDPTGVNGGMYYNSDAGKFRCYEGGVWKDCISAGGGSGDVMNGGQNGTVTLGTNDANSLVLETDGSARLTIDSAGNGTYSGHLLVGDTIATGSVLQVNTTSTSTSDGTWGLYTNLNANPDSASSAWYYGARLRAGSSSTNMSNGRIVGAQMVTNYTATSSTLNSMYGAQISFGNAIGDNSTVELYRGLAVMGPWFGTGSSITNYAGALVVTADSTQTTRQVGLWISDSPWNAQPNGDWALYSDVTDASYLGGGLTVAGQLEVGEPDTTGTLLVLDTKTDAGDPTGVQGAMYYNADSHKFRCYEGATGSGAWVDCIGNGDVVNGGQNGAVTIGTNDSNTLGFETNGTTRWNINSSGHLLPNADDTYDIGSDSLRVRDIYVGPSSIHMGVSGDEVVLSYDTATDMLNINQSLSIQGDIISNGTSLNLNATGAQDVNIATGSSTGDINIGNAASGDVSIYSSGTVGLYGNGGSVGIEVGSVFGLSVNTMQFSGTSSKSIRTSSQGSSNTGGFDFYTGNSGGSGTSSGNISIRSGNGTGTGTNSGSINIDSGTATGTAGTISIGAANASNLILGRNGINVNVGGNLVIGEADTTGTLLVLDTKTDSGDPTGVEGGMYYNSATKSFRCYNGTEWRSCFGGLAYVNTSTAGNTVTNTASETNFASKYNVPANSCVAGRVYRVTARGIWSSGGSNTMSTRLKWGSTVLNTNTVNGSGTANNLAWGVDATITCITSGVTGTVEVQGELFWETNSSGHYRTTFNNTGVVTVDTTIAQDLQMSFQWGTANSDSKTLRQFIVEDLGY